MHSILPSSGPGSRRTTSPISGVILPDAPRRGEGFLSLPAVGYGFPVRSEKEAQLIQRIARRAFVHATKMIYDANHRPDQQEGDPKVGGHPAACSSCIHILSALHLGIRQPQDFFAI